MGQWVAVLQSFSPSSSHPIEINREGTLTCIRCSCCNERDNERNRSLRRRGEKEEEKKVPERRRRLVPILLSTRETSPLRTRWLHLVDLLRKRKKAKTQGDSQGERKSNATVVGISDDVRSS